MTGAERAELVVNARAIIGKGSQSFAAASRIFDQTTRERAWLLYAWCRAADDMTDDQELGHTTTSTHDAAPVQERLEALTAAALDGESIVPLPFAALRVVVRETRMPRHFISDHLAGFALDAADWRPQSEDDLLRYCYHVAGAVGCMMAVVMGVDPDDSDTLDRACDLGLAFQLANIARDIVPDAVVGRCYVPAQWLAEQGITERAITTPSSRPTLAAIADRLVTLARPYRASARIGAARLSSRSRIAVLAADAIYGAIGEKVQRSGAHAWDARVRTGTAEKMALFALALLRSAISPQDTPRTGLWTRRHQSDSEAGSRSLPLPEARS